MTLRRAWLRARRRVRWHLTYGPLRLRAARLRRAGHPSEAVVLLFGVSWLIQTIRLVPHDLDLRQRLILSTLRKASANRFSQ